MAASRKANAVRLPVHPLHSTPKRIAYGVVGLLVCLTGALGNAMVAANLQNLQGTFSAWSTEIAWLPAVYVMTNVSINLLLVKFRQQFGLRAFTEGFLVLYVLVTFFHLFVNDLSSALMVRAAHGMVAAALSSLGIYYQIQAWPAKHRLKALTIGITGSSLAIPIARLFSTELLQLDEWRGLYLFELGLALISLGCVIALKLPLVTGARYSRRKISSPLSCWPRGWRCCARCCRWDGSTGGLKRRGSAGRWRARWC